MSPVVLLLGSGGKEHAWAISIKKSGGEILSWAPILNPGIEDLSFATIEAPYEKQIELIQQWIADIDLVIIGQTQPMLDGMGDWFEGLGIKTFNPNSKNAMLEGSKIFMRNFLDRHQIAGNVEFAACNDISQIIEFTKKSLEIVVKPDGLTGGEGVRVFGDHLQTLDDILYYAKHLIDRDGIVLLEKKIVGIEFSLQGFVEGENIIFFPLVKDYKRAHNGDTGLNTGSMGSCSFADHSLPYLSDINFEKAKSIIRQTLIGLKKENGPYKGAIYGQFMITGGGLKIIEFNTRLGDPEAINTLALLKTPLLSVIELLQTNSDLSDVTFEERATCVIYLVPTGYPENTEVNQLVILPKNIATNLHTAYVLRELKGYLTTKKRSFALIAKGKNLSEARKKVYELLSTPVDGLRFRTDIGLQYDKRIIRPLIV